MKLWQSGRWSPYMRVNLLTYLLPSVTGGEEVTTVSDVVVSSAGMFTPGSSRGGKRLRWGRVGGGV